MRIFATFKGFKNNPDLPTQFIWSNIKRETGESIDGDLFTYKCKLMGVQLKIGNRYQIICEINNSNIILQTLKNVKQVNKNPRCDIFRRFEGEFHIVGGKYAGKKDYEINHIELMRYCIWLGKNSYNEATIKNALELLEKLHENLKENNEN